jgi:hypothetical protein
MFGADSDDDKSPPVTQKPVSPRVNVQEDDSAATNTKRSAFDVAVANEHSPAVIAQAPVPGPATHAAAATTNTEAPPVRSGAKLTPSRSTNRLTANIAVISPSATPTHTTPSSTSSSNGGAARRSYSRSKSFYAQYGAPETASTAPPRSKEEGDHEQKWGGRHSLDGAGKLGNGASSSTGRSRPKSVMIGNVRVLDENFDLDDVPEDPNFTGTGLFSSNIACGESN